MREFNEVECELAGHLQRKFPGCDVGILRDEKLKKFSVVEWQHRGAGQFITIIKLHSLMDVDRKTVDRIGEMLGVYDEQMHTRDN